MSPFGSCWPPLAPASPFWSCASLVLSMNPISCLTRFSITGSRSCARADLRPCMTSSLSIPAIAKICLSSAESSKSLISLWCVYVCSRAWAIIACLRCLRASFSGLATLTATVLLSSSYLRNSSCSYCIRSSSSYACLSRFAATAASLLSARAFSSPMFSMIATTCFMVVYCCSFSSVM